MIDAREIAVTTPVNLLKILTMRAQAKAGGCCIAAIKDLKPTMSALWSANVYGTLQSEGYISNTACNSSLI